MTCRILPPTQPEWQTRFIDGRLFHARPGQFLDVTESEALRASHHGWTLVGAVGPAGARPTGSVGPGHLYLDLTVGKMLVWDGECYRDPATAEAV